MNLIFFKKPFSFYLRWYWIKFGLYLLYFVFFQWSNHKDLSFDRYWANTLIFLITVGVVEVVIYTLRLIFTQHRYWKATLFVTVFYVSLGIVGYYLLHGSQSVLSKEFWNREHDASYWAFFVGYNTFCWLFFKYAVVLFLVQQLLSFYELKKRIENPKPEKQQALQAADTVAVSHAATARVPPVEDVDKINDEKLILPLRERGTTYMIDVFRVVFIEVCDELSTIYYLDGTFVTVRISLTKLCDYLPSDRFARISKKHTIALPYIKYEKGEYLYMSGYEDRELKISGAYTDYKKWKESKIIH